jgi:RNA polymerase sigma-70 factor, ECF subfamily
VADIEHQIVAEIPRLRRYARVLVRDSTMADDLVQDCLERAWGRLHLWRNGSNLKAWLLTILHNIHANQARSRSRQPAMVPVDEDDADLRIEAEQIDLVAARDIAEALDRLPVDQRAVLILVGVEQFSYEEAAHTLGIPVGTVMSRLHRGRERLRRVLGLAVPRREAVS